MTRAVLLAVLVVGCSKPTIESACKNVHELKVKAIDRQIERAEVSLAGELVVRKKEIQSRKELDHAKCMIAVEQKDLDIECLAAADTLEEAVLKCLKGQDAS